MSDIVVTWPKTRRFASYVAALHNAKAKGLKINYRVGQHPPSRDRLYGDELWPPRLYRVHDGAVRGYTPIMGIALRAEGEVARVVDDPLEGDWPPGWYIVCEPEFIDCTPLPMKGFQGWRWFERTRVEQ